MNQEKKKEEEATTKEENKPKQMQFIKPWDDMHACNKMICIKRR
jgi:hypothetical protein